MGTNAAPNIANLFLYIYEREFIESLVDIQEPEINNHLLEISKSFHNTFRYIDDSLSVDNPYWEFFTLTPLSKSGTYPDQLSINNTTTNSMNANFLGMNVRLSMSGNLITKVFDKRREFNFHVNRFPSLLSTAPANTAGTFTGMLHYVYNLTTLTEDFLKVVITNAHTFKNDKYLSVKVMKKLFSNFIWNKINSHTFKYSDNPHRLIIRFNKKLLMYI